MFTTAISVVAKSWKPPIFASIGKWVSFYKQYNCIDAIEYYMAIIIITIWSMTETDNKTEGFYLYKPLENAH